MLCRGRSFAAHDRILFHVTCKLYLSSVFPLKTLQRFSIDLLYYFTLWTNAIFVVVFMELEFSCTRVPTSPPEKKNSHVCVSSFKNT